MTHRNSASTTTPSAGLPKSWLLVLAMFLGTLWATGVQAVAVQAPVIGEIQRIELTNPSDHWSGGTIVVGGTIVIIPRNMLIDLPANRVTLQQLFVEAPATCVAAGESGLAKADTCNTTGTGGFANIAANRTNNGNVIAGDVMIDKGLESIKGVVTYVDYNDGYFRLNGSTANPSTTGVMVRLNDPDARHTIQQGAGCAGGPNCSPDPRFTLDADNYTNVFTTGFPLCIPSTVTRNAPALPAIASAAVPAVVAGPTQAAADGTGDLLCPTTNRTVNNGEPVEDSRRFAPIMLGDVVTADGNFEKIGGVQFLSAHSTQVAKALSTKSVAGQPDYLFLAEVEMDAPGFQNQRYRTLIIGFATRAVPITGGADILIWSIHYDPVTNAPHEFPLASSQGCDLASGAGQCTNQGIVGAGNLIFKIRHDIDFLVGADPKLDPCSHLRADPRFAALNICPNTPTLGAANTAEMLGIVSPIPHEIQARTGHELANPGMTTIDVSGNEATHGQYLFPFGVGLGGIAFPEFDEIDLNGLGTANSFSGLPWLLDRRLSPAGCNGPCEGTPQPLDPFPFEGFDPRLLASMPTGNYSDPNYTASTLVDVRNRILSYVDPTQPARAGSGFETSGNFNGNSTLLAWPPVDPAFIPIAATPVVTLTCTAETSFSSAPPPSANAGPDQSVTSGTLVTLAGSGIGSPAPTFAWAQTNGPAVTLSNAAISNPTFTAPTVAGATTLTFRLTVTNSNGFSTDFVNVTVNPAAAPVVNPIAPQTVTSGTPVSMTATSPNSPVTFRWTQTGGSPTVLIPNPKTGPTQNFTVTLAPGASARTLTFRVTATNAAGVTSAPVFTTVRINPAP